MRRTRSLAALAAFAALAACSDTSVLPPVAPSPPAQPSLTATPAELDAEITTLIQTLLDNTLETQANLRWRATKRLADARQRELAMLAFVEFASWTIDNQRVMTPPPGETLPHATARLLGAAAAYVFGGAPPIAIGSRFGDAAVGIVLPNAPATIVTPSRNAGVAFQAGSVALPTVVIVVQNPNSQFAHCAGPLRTALCQYPTFYRFEAFPYRRLLKPARFGVCHVNAGPFAPAEGIHDRFRLAHTKPADSANYTPNAVRPEGENVEILPLVNVSDFLDCANTSYGVITPKDIPLRERHWYDRGLLALGNAIESVGDLLTPKNAYAIDLGGGGEGWAFSDFNVVDPQSNRIDFETFPGGASTSPSCDNGCPISKQYEREGLTFDFVRQNRATHLGFVSMEKGGNNPRGDGNNNYITNARADGEGGGYWTGTIIMNLVQSPHSFTFLVRVNNASPPVTVNAFGPAGRLSDDHVLRSKNPVVYRPCTSCAQFREETITVQNDGGIARIELPGGRYLLMVDDLRLTPQ